MLATGSTGVTRNRAREGTMQGRVTGESLGQIGAMALPMVVAIFLVQDA